MADRRYTPIHQTHRRNEKVAVPQQTADTFYGRTTKSKVAVTLGHSKPPKMRFKPGDRFAGEGSVWELMYMYRLRDQPNVWIHALAERSPMDNLPVASRLIDAVVDCLGGGDSTERVVLTPFASYYDASQYFRDIPMKTGLVINKKTQDLLKFKKL